MLPRFSRESRWILEIKSYTGDHGILDSQDLSAGKSLASDFGFSFSSDSDYLREKRFVFSLRYLMKGNISTVSGLLVWKVDLPSPPLHLCDRKVQQFL